MTWAPIHRWCLIVGVPFVAVLLGCRAPSTSEHPTPVTSTSEADTGVPPQQAPSASLAPEGEAQGVCVAASGPFDERGLLEEIATLQHSLGDSEMPTSGREQPCPPPCAKVAKKARSKPRPGEQTDPWSPQPLDEREQRLCSLYLRYAEDGADPDIRQQVRYRHSKLLVRKVQFDAAISALEQLIGDHPDPRLAAWAAEMLVDVLTIRWTTAADRAPAREHLLQWVERLPSLTLWDLDEARRLREQVPTLRIGLLVERAKAARDAEPPDPATCAKSYVEALEPNLGQRIDELLFNAAACFELAGDPKAAAERRRELLRRVPDSPLADKTRAQLKGSSTS